MPALNSKCHPLSKTSVKPKRIQTLEQYLQAVSQWYERLWSTKTESLYTCPRLWFRGLKSSSYSLLPSIVRAPYQMSDESALFPKFQALALPYLDQIPGYSFSGLKKGYWPLLFLMQHYGVPTRLMDWSASAFVALLFAVDPDATPSELAQDPAVWCLNPTRLNLPFEFREGQSGYIPNALEPKVTELFGPNKTLFCGCPRPCAIYGPLNSTRIIAQQGTFSVFPTCEKLIALELLPNADEFLGVIQIDKNFRSELNESLRRIGLVRAELFPELASVASLIKQEGI